MADAVARTGATSSQRSGPPAGGSGNGESQPGFLTRCVDFCRGSVVEMKKVTWPDVPQVRSATISIIIFVLLLGLAITVMDFVLQGILIKGIPSLFAR